MGKLQTQEFFLNIISNGFVFIHTGIYVIIINREDIETTLNSRKFNIFIFVQDVYGPFLPIIPLLMYVSVSA